MSIQRVHVDVEAGTLWLNPGSVRSLPLGHAWRAMLGDPPASAVRLVPLPDREAWAAHTLDVGARYGDDRTWWECGCGLRLTDPIRDEDGIGIPEASELHLVHLHEVLSGDTR